jgi:cytochrome oxidase Cu insertion factor (SCO1/SenC/PrrC family)
MMTLAMQDLATSLQRTPVHLVSITVDPARDTPERLRRYAEERLIDLRRWTFLTGDLATVKRVVGSLKLALEEDPVRTITLPDGSNAPNILHSTKLILIGPDRKALGLYNSDDPTDTARLARDARELSKHARR